jgi:hypothetical protein
VGGVLSAFACGHPIPHGHPLAGLLAFDHLGDPSAAWDSPVGPPVVYWSISLVVIVVAAAAASGLYRLVGVLGAQAGSGGRSDGLAARAQVRRAASVRVLTRRGRLLRPAVSAPRVTDVGYLLGRASGVGCWASVEDSLVVLGPPRSGKGLHLVIPAILDAPGAVVTTGTRPDNLVATIKARGAGGRAVAVFDPQGLAPDIAATMRWSPIRGCEVPRVAMARATALCAEPAAGVENGSFWKQQCFLAVRCLLHAAALDHRAPVELYRWSLSPLAAEDVATILRTHPAAAPAWSTALEAILAADPRQRDSTWAMVANTFAALADPHVLDAVSPSVGEAFDPDDFLRERGTLYLLGTASGSSATANLVAAFVEDIVESARRRAASSLGSRLDPPLAVILDEAANYPLPSLPSLMSDGGGTGVTTFVVLQSLAQARALGRARCGSDLGCRDRQARPRRRRQRGRSARHLGADGHSNGAPPERVVGSGRQAVGVHVDARGACARHGAAADSAVRAGSPAAALRAADPAHSSALEPPS